MLSLWNPFVPVVRANSDSRISTKNYFDRLFEDSFATMTQDLFGGHLAGIGIEQKKNEDGSLSVSIDVPGIKQEDIAIEITDNVVQVKGERKTATSSYAVSKSLTIPEGYSSDDIKAELTDGVLTIILAAKQPVQKEVKKIPITSPNKLLK
jgi:HSP20 family protein